LVQAQNAKVQPIADQLLKILACQRISALIHPIHDRKLKTPDELRP
jgi:hypothetical protein